MNNLLKTMTLSAITSTLLFSGDSFVDTVGLNLGKVYSDHSIEQNSGAVIIPHEPYKNYNAIELFTTLQAINEDKDIKPYISYTYSKNMDMKHQYLLAGVNKYFKTNTVDFYGGAIGGYGQEKWQYNPINNSKDNKNDARSFILGLQAGLDYPVSSKLNFGVNAKYLLHDYETQFEPSSGVSATLSHERTIFIGLGLSYKFGEESPKDSDQDGVMDDVDSCPNSELNEIVDDKGCAKDSDNDGIKDKQDVCPDTPHNATVNSDGCPIDSDKDGVLDYLDKCLNSETNEIVDANGCAKDSDNDGVIDSVDTCPQTPLNNEVDENGCLLDLDKDGIVDINDSCPNSAFNETVDEKGCAKDSDNDGVIDRLDQCSGTPNGYSVDKNGCEVNFTIHINFPSSSAVINDTYDNKIKELSDFLKMHPSYTALIEAYTDSTGSAGYNKKLSQKRAKALYEKLLELGTQESRITYKGLGEAKPIADNETEEGKALNRRIEVTFMK